ncbi:MAG TPA: hypothetical protein VNJ29_00800, partial [Candidatus Nitrosotenuis sp.]|nr:hypothetical protein [Candidatus Nitrosotenuis sp.]
RRSLLVISTLVSMSIFSQAKADLDSCLDNCLTESKECHKQCNTSEDIYNCKKLCADALDQCTVKCLDEYGSSKKK